MGLYPLQTDSIELDNTAPNCSEFVLSNNADGSTIVGDTNVLVLEASCGETNLIVDASSGFVDSNSAWMTFSDDGDNNYSFYHTISSGNTKIDGIYSIDLNRVEDLVGNQDSSLANAWIELETIIPDESAWLTELPMICV